LSFFQSALPDATLRLGAYHYMLCTAETRCTSDAPKCTKTHHFFDFSPFVTQ